MSHDEIKNLGKEYWSIRSDNKFGFTLGEFGLFNWLLFKFCNMGNRYIDNFQENSFNKNLEKSGVLDRYCEIQKARDLFSVEEERIFQNY